MPWNCVGSLDSSKRLVGGDDLLSWRWERVWRHTGIRWDGLGGHGQIVYVFLVFCKNREFVFVWVFVVGICISVCQTIPVVV